MAFGTSVKLVNLNVFDVENVLFLADFPFDGRLPLASIDLLPV